ncbi:hypothetical protein [Paraburkholderia sp. SOS3]|jgi:hypothetical protein|uniref:hypothetical protein n=1 Tax=Paraburkholderia sp. SOS3 TaxID=1926494 RepID=UPI0012EC7D71|nr:hypothetical protein [Paraburkholderia sp. SOS3]
MPEIPGSFMPEGDSRGILRRTPDPGPTQPDDTPYFPWMEIADRWLATAGFKPGERVSFSIDYRYNN